jgi:hypothetical protein
MNENRVLNCLKPLRNEEILTNSKEMSNALERNSRIIWPEGVTEELKKTFVHLSEKNPYLISLDEIIQFCKMAFDYYKEKDKRVKT